MASRGDININEVQPNLFNDWGTLKIEDTIEKSGSFTKLKSKDYFNEGKFPVIDQGDKFISGFVNDENLLYKGELPVIIFGDHTRNVKYIDFPFATGADGTKVLKPKRFYNPKFYHYYFKSLKVPNLGYSRHFAILKEIDFPLPPLAEQNRIVDKLDRLFTQLESIKTSLEKIPVLLKDFRQQVLTQAVTGKLTEEWRKGKELVEWNYELAQDCCEKVQSGGTPKGSNFDTSGIPFLKVYNIVNNKIDFEYNPQYVSELIQNSQIKKSITFPGDVVMNIVGPPLNKIAIIPEDYPEWNLNQAITLFRTKNYLSNKFLYYFFCEGSSVNSLINETKGVVGQVNISLSQCRNFLIPVPSPKEQQEIVFRVESLFAKADAIEKQYKNLKQKIDTLPQAILHKAFKGELSEQLDSDGDARELLREIEALKVTNAKVGKKLSKPLKLYEEKEKVLDMVADPKEKINSKVVKLKPTNAEIYKRTLLAAEIVYQLKETNTLGHLKLQKMLYLCQEIGSMNLPMNFLKQAMGPYDNQLARSLDKQFVIKKWFEYQKEAPLKYKSLENCGSHKGDFQKYFELETEQINYLINKFKKFTSPQIEAVATLYACWKEAIEKKELISDKLIITKFYQWSKEKEKFREENLIKALDWMRRNGVEPK